MARRLDKLMDDVQYDSLCHRVAAQEIKVGFGRLLDAKAVALSRQVALEAGETVFDLGGFRSAVGSVVEMARGADMPIHSVADWFAWHVNSSVWTSRLSHLIPEIPIPLLNSWEDKGQLVDDYSVPADDLAEARALGNFREYRRSLSPSQRQQFDARSAMLMVPDCMMVNGTDRHGTRACRPYYESAAIAAAAS